MMKVVDEPRAMPNCICGTKLREEAGGSFGGDLTQRNASCVCGRLGAELEIAGIHIILLSAEGQHERAHAWANGVFLKRIARTETFAIRDIRHDWNLIKARPDVAICAVPPDLAVLQELRDGTWKTWTHQNSKDVPIPPDPERASTLKYWDERFAELERALHTAIARRESPNQYYRDEGSEPWFTFKLHGVEVTTGWRKRVIAIKWKSEKPTPKLEALAKTRDNVTYDGHHPGDDLQEAAEAHAYGPEKWLEYVLALAEDLSS